MTTNFCIDCGKPISPGALRCADDRGRELQRRHLTDTTATDAMVLQMVAEGASSGEIERRLGISRTRAVDKISEAKRREAKRKELGLPAAYDGVTA